MIRPTTTFRALGITMTAATLLLGCSKADQGGGAPQGKKDDPEERTPTALVSGAVDVRGSAIHIKAAGPEDGAPILFLHGARYTSKTWEGLGTLDKAAVQGYRAIAVDLPGYGESAPSGIKDRDFLAPLIEALGIDAPVIVSPSMSGRYSLPYVCEHADRVAAFVPIAPVGINDVRDGLADATMPVLVMWGSDDLINPVAVAEDLAGRLPNAKTLIFEGAGHACYLEDPKTFHDELFGFLERALGE